MTDLQREHDERRALYMDSKVSHQDHYMWLAQRIGISVSDLPVPVERVAASKDEYLNDISLPLWDRCDPSIRRKAFAAGMRSWSLSDTVCVLKAFARDAAQRAVTP